MRKYIILAALLLATVTLLADSTVASDTFSEATTNTVLTSHTMDQGTGWTLNEDTSGGTAIFSAMQSADTLQPSATANSVRVSYYSTENPALSGADVAVQATFTATFGSADDTFYLIARRTASDTYYAALWYAAAVATDAYILKVLGGVVTQVDSGDCAPANGSVMKFTVTGTSTTTLTLTKDGSACGTAVTGTDSSSPITDPGHCGVGAGNLRSGTDDVQAFEVDDYSCIDVTEAGGGGGGNSLFRTLFGVG